MFIGDFRVNDMSFALLLLAIEVIWVWQWGMLLSLLNSFSGGHGRQWLLILVWTEVTERKAMQLRSAVSERDRKFVECVYIFYGLELKWEWSWGGRKTNSFLVLDVARA